MSSYHFLNFEWKCKQLFNRVGHNRPFCSLATYPIWMNIANLCSARLAGLTVYQTWSRLDLNNLTCISNMLQENRQPICGWFSLLTFCLGAGTPIFHLYTIPLISHMLSSTMRSISETFWKLISQLRQWDWTPTNYPALNRQQLSAHLNVIEAPVAQKFCCNLIHSKSVPKLELIGEYLHFSEDKKDIISSFSFLKEI